MKKVYKKITSLILIMFGFFVTSKSAQAIELVGSLRGECVNKGDCNPCDFLQLFVNASNILVGLSGTFAVIMFVYGGIVLITAYGNESRISWGKNTIIATVIGIGIVLFAWSLINLLIIGIFGTPNPAITWYSPQEGSCVSQ